MKITIELQGPCVCDICLRGPAFDTPLGFRCHTHWTIDLAAANPVPLPRDPAMLADLRSLWQNNLTPAC
jgi:hypothetical protein